MSKLRIRAIAFDLYGTLFDISKLTRKMQRLASEPEAFTAIWRAKQLQYSFLMSLIKSYLPFRELTRKALTSTLDMMQLTLTGSEKRRLMNEWLRLELYPKTEEILRILKERYSLAILTNGDSPSVNSLLSRSAIRSYFKAVTTADEVETFKPSPRIYALASKHLRIPPRDILMVSSNGFDVLGAKAAGMKACWINRAGEALDPLGFRPDLTSPQLDILLTL
jgi:2-haloacid dehalogenase